MSIQGHGDLVCPVGLSVRLSIKICGTQPLHPLPCCRVPAVEAVASPGRLWESAWYFHSDHPDFKELDGENGAAILAKQLTEHCTTLRVFIGRARNPGYEGKDVPLDLDMKLKAIDHLCALLEEDGKRVEKNYY